MMMIARRACVQAARSETAWLLCSPPVWLHHHLRGGVPSCAPLCAAQQLGGNPPGCAQVCVRVPAAGGSARPEHRRVVKHPGNPVAHRGHSKREWADAESRDGGATSGYLCSTLGCVPLLS